MSRNATRHTGIITAFSAAFVTVAMLLASFAHGAQPNPGLDENGNWSRPGPGIVINETHEPGDDLYIIRHQAPSLAQYRGDIPGLAATSPETIGTVRLDPDSAASQAYLGYLAGIHADLAAAISARLGRTVDVAYRYDAVFNGIAVRMTAAEAESIASLPGIRRVERDSARELLTDAGPQWIGAEAVHDGSATPGNLGTMGEGIVVGIIDTGINSDHPSFADIGGDGYDHTNPRPTFLGACDPVLGVPFCNDKLIGVYDFTQTTPEDDNGHGSHTASTTAGNFVTARMQGPTTVLERPISGVAPHANIISYKACQNLTGNCLLTAILGSINAATLDVVDVINFSIGGTSANPWTDSDSQAFLDAHAAGIFVATSAGNSGPNFGTLGSPADAPWVTSVGASTHNRQLANGVVDMTGGNSAAPADIIGAGITSGYGPAKIVWAGDYPSTKTTTPELCGAGVGDPATGEGSEDPPWPPGTFNGEIVLCERGEYGRVHKGQNVLDAGAGGYILMNDPGNGDSLVADAHVLPGVHISYDDGVVLKAWLADGGTDHTGRIRGMSADLDPNNGDRMASFSSRGANPAAPSLIKPDVTAPGVDILAAFHTPAGTLPGSPDEYNIISGTSMSSPHTAGAGALIRSIHPDWSPDEVKSALMTVAFNDLPGTGDEVHDVFKEDGATPADPFDMGGGRVDLRQSAIAGFVLDETNANYAAADPAAGGDARTLNIASLGNNDCGSDNADGTCSWTRTIRSTVDRTVSWNVTGSAPAGMTVSASPSFFTLAPGASQTIVFTADVSAVSPKGNWTFGEVRLAPSDASIPAAHFPVAVIPKPFGGGVAGTILYFHGNQHDDCASSPTGAYQGRGDVDVAAGCEPFLSGEPLDDVNGAASWGPLNPALNGPTLDPHWTWTVSGDTRIAGPMIVSWWAAQDTANPLFDTNFDVTLTVDGTVLLTERVSHQFQTPGLPQLLTSTINVPDVTATSTIELKIDPVFIDTGNGITIYYDSEQACPGGSGSCDSRVSMPVRSGPIPPVANDDAAFLAAGATVTVDVLANDFDPEGGPLAVSIVTAPLSGTAEVTLNNAIRYTHDGSATSSDALEYEITDNDGLTARATVEFTISAECLQPAGNYADDFETGAPGWSVDTDVVFLPSATWTLSSPELSAHSGSTTWFTDANAQDPEQNADTSKDVRLVSPPQLLSSTSELTFWHHYATEAGFDGGVLEISTDDGASWEDIVTAGGVFTQGGYTGALSAGSGFALSGRNAWTGISGTYPDSMEQVSVDLSFFAGQEVRIRFRFGQDVLLGQPAGGWWIDDVAFSDLLENCATQPPVARPDSDTVTAGGSVTTDVKANDSDPDTDNASLVVTDIITPPQHGTAVIVSTDEVEYTHGGNDATMDFYEYRVEDQEGNFDTAIVTITIDRGVNAAPVANDDSAAVDAGQSVTIDVKANDDDANHPNAELTVTIETAPASGVAGVNGDGSITYTHNGDAATSDSFEYRLTDPQGASDIATVLIAISQDATGECRNDLCANDEVPDELLLTFVGGACTESDNSQGAKASCTDHVPGGPSGAVLIRATNKENASDGNAKVYFDGVVNEGQQFTISAAMADENNFGSKVFLHVYNADGSTLLQTVEIHTSCSAPLLEGERFGSLKLGGPDADASDPICSTGQGRVHGSGFWDRGTGQKHDKIDFSFDAKVSSGGFKGKLKVHDKDIDLKIDAKTITSLSTGNGEMCDGELMDGVNTFAFTATGTFEFGDEETVDARFFACGTDNGKNNSLPLDNFYVECVDGCGYNTAVRIMEDSNDIAGGNIHLHDAIVDADNGAEPAAAETSGTGEPQSSQPESEAATKQAESQNTASEGQDPTDVVTLEPMLLSTAPAGTPMVVTAIVERNGTATNSAPVTLHWTTGTGVQGEAAAVADDYGVAAFVVTLPAGDVEYTARSGDVESNGMRVTGF